MNDLFQLYQLGYYYGSGYNAVKSQLQHQPQQQENRQQENQQQENRPPNTMTIPTMNQPANPRILPRPSPFVPFPPLQPLLREPSTPLALARAAYDDQTSTETQKEPKRLTKEELKGLLHLYFNTTFSLREFCRRNSLNDSHRKQMYRVVGKHELLKKLEGERALDEKRNEALEIINRLLPGQDYRRSPVSQDPARQTTTAASTQESLPARHARAAAPTQDSVPPRVRAYIHPNDELFYPQHIAQVAQSLDFSSEPRMARGSDREHTHE